MADNTLTVLQLVRLRGRITAADVAETTRLAQDRVEAVIRDAIGRGEITSAGDRVRLSTEGRETLARLLAEESRSTDSERLVGEYERFVVVNQAFKQLITDWQVRDGTANDHTDPAYDQAVIERLHDIHRQIVPILSDLVTVAPRLAMYAPRLECALERVDAGDHTWIARPLIDSYHTAWFELHEDLIGLGGLTRAEEAAAGRAQ